MSKTDENTQKWLKEFQQEAERYSLQVMETAVEGENVALVFRNKNGAYFLVAESIETHPGKVRPFGPYDTITRMDDGNYLCKDSFGQEIYNPKGEMLSSISPPPLAGRHLFEYL